ncbi:hypothetical protein DFR55_11257 [Herbinix hemicellulosilytica]|uniref:Uncharacterized protein n=1 Tax=Herbinix hemicellulosilytica TaxID=1564487 RepID=A0A0H5SUY1_HERHM|nr:hypothetical protein DFR55_11257 [Herbinix hemicellulosilytica]CRZ34113.1 hypothetical protein HHT355_0910 [Herbinix hemicellulosilytica]
MKEHKIYGLIENSPLLPKLPDNISQILFYSKIQWKQILTCLLKKYRN